MFNGIAGEKKVCMKKKDSLQYIVMNLSFFFYTLSFLLLPHQTPIIILITLFYECKILKNVIITEKFNVDIQNK